MTKTMEERRAEAAKRIEGLTEEELALGYDPEDIPPEGGFQPAENNPKSPQDTDRGTD